jgi:hypothetical protein
MSMKHVTIIGREMAILSPGEVWGMPDNIADQIIARGKGQLVEDKKIKKGKE